MVAQNQVTPYTFTDELINETYTCNPGTELYPTNNTKSLFNGMKPLVFIHGGNMTIKLYL